MTTNFKGFDPVEARGPRGKKYKVSVTVKEEFLPLLQHHSDPSLEEDEQTTKARLEDFFQALDMSSSSSYSRPKVFYATLHYTTIHPEKVDSLNKILENIPDDNCVRNIAIKKAKEAAPMFKKKLENIAKQKEKKKEKKKMKNLSKKVEMIDKKMNEIMEIVSTSVAINSQVAHAQHIHANQLSIEGEKEINIKYDQLGESPPVYTFETKEIEEHFSNKIKLINQINEYLSGYKTKEEENSTKTVTTIGGEQLSQNPNDFDDTQTVHINYTRKKSISSKGKKEEKPSKETKSNQEENSNDDQNQKEANIPNENSDNPKSPKAENEIDTDVSTEETDGDLSPEEDQDLVETDKFQFPIENSSDSSDQLSSDSSNESIEDEEHNLEYDKPSSEDEEISPEEGDQDISSEENDGWLSPEEEDQFSPGDDGDEAVNNAASDDQSYSSDDQYDGRSDDQSLSRSNSVSPQRDPTPVKEYNFFFN